MAVDARRFPSGPRDLSARERRQKLVLAVGLLILGALVAIQGPGLLRQLRGDSPAASAPAAAPAPATASGGQPAPAAPAAAPIDAKALAALRRLPAKDPFLVQVGAAGGTIPTPSPPTPPAVRSEGFVRKDPFVAQITGANAAPARPAPAPGGPAQASGGSGYIVVLASVPVANGETGAELIAKQARGAGLTRVGVLESARYATLRSGYYAVYLGTFSRLDGARQALLAARSRGFATAYTRRIGR